MYVLVVIFSLFCDILLCTYGIIPLSVILLVYEMPCFHTLCSKGYYEGWPFLISVYGFGEVSVVMATLFGKLRHATVMHLEWRALAP